MGARGFVHIIAVIFYGLLAIAAAALAPFQLHAVEPLTAAGGGGLLFLACGLLHLSVLNGRRHAALAARIESASGDWQRIAAELERARGEFHALHDVLEARSKRHGGDGGRNMDEMVAEVRVLQQLVEQLSTAQGGGEFVGGSGTTSVRPHLAAVRSDDAAPAERDEAAILEIVRDALRLGRVDLYLQPVVSLPQRKKRYYECFSRIRAEDGSIVFPEQYLALADRAGLMAAIDNMLLFRCVQLVRRTQRRNRNLGFFCNISPRTLNDIGFFADFIDFMRQNRDLAPNLIFEMSQASYRALPDRVRDSLEELAAIGYRFSMDQVTDLNLDYGLLQQLSLRFVKIDSGVLKAQLSRAENDGPVLLKSRLDRIAVDLVAEKVETEQTLVELSDLQLDFGQGYLFGEPRLSREAA